MAYVLVGEGTNQDIASMPSYEYGIEEGSRCQIRINCLFEVPRYVLDALQSTLVYAGVEEVSVTSIGPVVYITFRKGFAWLPIIAAAILGSIALAIVIVTWQIFKEVGPVGSSFLIIGAVIVIGIAGIAYINQTYPGG